MKDDRDTDKRVRAGRGDDVGAAREDEGTLRSRMQQQQEQINELQATVKAYEDKFNQIKEPPLLAAYITRTTGDDLEDEEVVVAHGSQVLKVTAGNVERKDLRLGQYVWLHPKTYAIIASSRQMEQGVVGKVVDMYQDKLIVTTSDGMERKIIDMPRELTDEIKIGYEVSLLPPSYEILEVRPSSEIRDLFLGETPNVRYAQIGGLDETIDRIRDVVELPYREPELFKQIRLKAPKGVLLYGPPGCGKTLIGKAVATENSFTFFNVKVADILSKWVGESENMIKALFRKARENAPSIIFFDEFDALGTTRGQQDSAGVQKNIIAQILSEMDGIDALKDVYILGATNRPDMIDPALLRPGRFDEVIEIQRPNKAAAMHIINIYLTPDLPIQDAYIREHGGSKEKALEAMKAELIEELYGDNKWVEFKLDPEAKESVKTIKRKDIISGALVESIITTAKKNYVKRVLPFPKGSPERAREGLNMEDLRKAAEEESKEHALVESSVYQKRQRERARFAASDSVEVM